MEILIDESPWKVIYYDTLYLLNNYTTTKITRWSNLYALEKITRYLKNDGSLTTNTY